MPTAPTSEQIARERLAASPLHRLRATSPDGVSIPLASEVCITCGKLHNITCSNTFHLLFRNVTPIAFTST